MSGFDVIQSLLGRLCVHDLFYHVVGTLICLHLRQQGLLFEHCVHQCFEAPVPICSDEPSRIVLQIPDDLDCVDDLAVFQLSLDCPLFMMLIDVDEKLDERLALA